MRQGVRIAGSKALSNLCARAQEFPLYDILENSALPQIPRGHQSRTIAGYRSDKAAEARYIIFLRDSGG
jgi:hypothetical protein